MVHDALHKIYVVCSLISVRCPSFAEVMALNMPFSFFEESLDFHSESIRGVLHTKFCKASVF